MNAAHRSLRRLTAGAAVLGLLAGSTRAPAADTIRPAHCAGQWYPGDASELGELVDGLLARGSPAEVVGRPIALICPHAGYRFSAPVAAAACAALGAQSYARVIVLAFSHRHTGSYRGVDVPKELSAYATPLGPVPIDREACDRLLAHPLFASRPQVGAGEHSLELQLPLLQRKLKQFRLVPLLVGQLSDAECAEAAWALRPLVDRDTLLVASSDFTHFGPNYGYQPFHEDIPRQLEALADQAARPLLDCNYDGFEAHLASTADTICGRGPIALLLRVLSMGGGAGSVRAARETSGALTGDWTNSVTYQSFVFTARAGQLSDKERDMLLQLARRTVGAALNGEAVGQPDMAGLPPVLCRPGACFVTLTNRGRLRGCIGEMAASGPLCQSVVRHAVAACHDPRFVDQPVTASELAELDLEISFLTPLVPVSDVTQIVVGRDGLYLVVGSQRGVLLPQVAYERGWTRLQFLAATCQKAGLPPDAWRRPGAVLQRFEAEVFGEHRSGPAAGAQPAPGPGGGPGDTVTGPS